jgi:amidase
MSNSELCFLPAAEIAAGIRAKRFSSVEVMQAYLKQIEQVNPALNAIVTLDAEGALAKAKAADAALAAGTELGSLHGLPIAHKDTLLTRGMRTTFGSPIYKNFVPEESHLIVDRAASAGAINLGKTNTPEFAAGSQTYNTLFGKTLNPYDLSRTCGGSSGGAAVALAAGLVPLADGSDLAASLRNPANFCNVVGFRPSPGRIPVVPAKHAWGTLSVEGPMGRTVADAALLFSVQAGPDARAPVVLETPGQAFGGSLARDFKGTRIALSPTFGGQLQVDAQVAAMIAAQGKVFESMGCALEEAVPDFSGAHEVFHIQRAMLFEINHADHYREHRDQLKSSIIWNIEAAHKLTPQEIARAERERARICALVSKFFETYEFLVVPVNQVLPFSADQEYPTEINGEKLTDYISWMKSCYYITLTGHPAISVPCGFSSEGLPIGVQIVGRRHADLSVLQLAHAFESATQVWRRRPAMASQSNNR